MNLSCFKICNVAVAPVVACWIVSAATPSSADWPQFRGPNSSGVVDDTPPVEFGPGKNELWNLDVEPGHSSPCIAGDLLFYTSFNREAKRLNVVCVNRLKGEIKWQREFEPERFEKGHPSFNPASSSPATDGNRVVAYFGSYGLVCFDMDGEKQWEIRMPVTKSYAGNATSPVIVGDHVILYRGNHVDHFLIAVDKKSGNEIWRVDQDEPFVSELACTAVPICTGDTLLVHSARSVQAIDIESGKQKWVTKCATTATSTPIIAEDQVVIAAWNKLGEPALRPEFPKHAEMVAAHDKDDDGTISQDEYPRLMLFHRPDGAEAPQNGAPMGFRRADHDRDGEITSEEWDKTLKGVDDFRSRYETHGILAIPIASEGLVQQDKVRSLEEQGIPEVPSPLFYNGLIYCVKNGGVLTTIDLKSGDRLSRVRTKGAGTHYASPLIAGERLYSTAGDGTISVLSLGNRPKVLAVNKMNESTYATPAVSDDVLYVRTHKKLYAFGNK